MTCAALAAFAQVCREAQVRWSLYRETLLLAAVPADIQPEGAQVAVFAADWPRLLPALQAHGHIRWEDYCGKRCRLGVILDGHRLDVTVLCPVESQTGLDAFAARLKPIRRKSLLGLPKGKRALKKALAAAPKSGGWMTDCLTEKKPLLLEGEWFGSFTRLGGWPVFGGWQAYLRRAYGDYEHGLTDAVGLGLTVEEKAALAAHQSRCRQALAFVDEVAKEQGLRYTLLAGSVLGPVRHGGFIPWDDDIDIGIRTGELAAFEEALARELPRRLPEGFALVRPAAGDPYPRMFSKLCYEGRCCMDLWPLVPTYTHGFRARLTRALGRLLTKAHYRKIGYKVTQFARTAAVIGFFLSDRQIMALARWNERKYETKNPTAWINLYSIYSREKETIPALWLDTPATACFDGLQVPVVGCTEEYLRHLYGDYMAFPPPWSRASRHTELFFQ